MVPQLGLGAAALMSIPGLIKGGTGIWQLLKGNEYAQVDRPEYQIPESVYKSLGVIQDLASQRGLPGERVLEDKARQTTQGALTAAKEYATSPGDIDISGIFEGERRSMENIGLAGEQFYAQNQGMLADAYANVAPYEQKEWEYNELMPYLQSMDAARRLRTSGAQNIMSGVGDVTGVMWNRYLANNPDVYSRIARRRVGDYYFGNNDFNSALASGVVDEGGTEETMWDWDDPALRDLAAEVFSEN